MALFAVDEIHALLLTAASKAGVGNLDKKGFEILSKEIQREIPRTAHGVFLSYRYLRESIYDKVTEALKEGKYELGFNRDYIDTLCQFAGYKSFNTFHDHFNKWEKELQGLRSESDRVAILFTPEDEASALDLQKIAELNKMECIQRSIKVNGEEILNLPDEVLFAIMVLGQSPFADDTLKLTSQWAQNISSPIFIYTPHPGPHISLPPEWSEKPLLEPQDCHLFFAMAKMYMHGLAEKKTYFSRHGGTTHIHANNVGAIFMGNTRIAAEFSVQEDMNLTNHHHKGS